MAESTDMPLSQARAAFFESGLLLLHPITPLDSSCPICLDDYTPEHRPVIINDVSGCRHVFGKTCLEVWLRTSNTCPICRAILYFVPRLPSRRHINNTFWEEIFFMLTMVVHPQAQEIMEGSRTDAADDYPLPAEEGYVVGRMMFLQRIFRQRQQQRQTPLMTGLWLCFVAAWESAVNLLQALKVHLERMLERDRLNRLQALRSNASLPDWDDEWMESEGSDSGSETHTDPQPSSTAEIGPSAPEVSGREDEDPGIMLVCADADSDSDSDFPDGCSCQ
ncbi:hypothetical protein IQ07DRAFT_603934 [Pyrenochaeta sp. DS3sAY3a]|nr:hypothetical protein IQ07DRAFT_603934 [Pyrenochaeta sp. DS3sAY3a]